MRILIVEDEIAIASGLRFNFEQEGYDVVEAADGPTALRLFADPSAPIDLIVLDLMLPGMSGYEICRKVRESDAIVPILVLSARMLSEDRSHAFDCGADQYLTKPFALPELLTRVRNLLVRRQHLQEAARKVTPPPTGTGNAGPALVRFGAVEVNYDTFEVTVQAITHRLTTLEMQLMRYFLENAGRVLSRAEILEHVWDQSADVTTRTIDNFVVRLRKLIEPDPANPQHILSIRGTGYRFVTGTQDPA